MSMAPNDRKAELVRRGITMASIARELGVTPSHVQAVVAGDRRAPRVQQAVANALGRSLAEVFPSPDSDTATAGAL